ncbi:hypothetical protein K491DRAFT_761613 [Lophiostoma macrostomum CBS 122681]|uniref:Zn(2)-C6 fungal-type domain-containing protein n=1 Tax=Lophiostoma macrostomum CBS 122681 TaxID=1314788 RepID=A0A6A6SVI9_9PLEO|nr:hypothetical protein K491DRAFT_761613 [Lophiostoma macrostomum CBS 122681]
MSLIPPAKSSSQSKAPRPNHPPPRAAQSRKLKASCDFCALSKVKCDRGQPQCTKCIRSDLTCHYSESRRIGKARLMCAMSSASSESAGLGVERTNTTSAPESTSMSSAAEPGHPEDEQRPATTMSESAGFSTPPPIDPGKWPDYPMDMGFFDEQSHLIMSETPRSSIDSGAFALGFGLNLGMTDFAMSNTGFSGQERLDRTYTANNNPLADAIGLEKLEMQPFSQSSPSCSSPDQTEDSSWPFQEPTNNDCQCIWRAFTVVQMLHRANASCTQLDFDSVSSRGTQSTPQGLDATLTANRIAIETVGMILQCSCARSLAIYSMVVLIVHQVLVSYCKLLAASLSAYIIPGKGEHASSSSSTSSFPPSRASSMSSAPPMQSQSPMGSTVFDVPFAIGGYVLKHTERDSILKHVLRSEIEKLGVLIARIRAYHTSDDPVQNPVKAFVESLVETRRISLEALVPDYLARRTGVGLGFVLI